MAKQLGRKMLIKYLSSAAGANPKVYTTVAAFTSKSITIDNASIDATTGDGTIIWTDRLQGIRSMSLTGDGVFTDGAAENAIEAAATGTGAAVIELQILVPDYATYTGLWFIESFEYGGELDGAVTFSCSFVSSGTITRATV